MRYFVAPVGAFHVQVIESASAVHDTDGAAGILVQVAESEPDQPAVLPACTYSVALAPADNPVVDFDRPDCPVHAELSELVRYFVAPDTAGHDHMIESASAVHDTTGAGGICRVVVQVAESVVDHPAVLPACTYNVAFAPADKLLVDFHRPDCSVHAELSELVWYFVAPVTAGHVQVIDDEVAVHETTGAAGIVVQVAESVLDQPAALPACTSSLSEAPADRSSLVFDRPVCSDHCPAPSCPPKSNLVWYFVAPVAAGHDHVIESASAVHDTTGSGGIVVQVAESEPDHVPWL